MFRGFLLGILLDFNGFYGVLSGFRGFYCFGMGSGGFLPSVT